MLIIFIFSSYAPVDNDFVINYDTNDLRKTMLSFQKGNVVSFIAVSCLVGEWESAFWYASVTRKLDR